MVADGTGAKIVDWDGKSGCRRREGCGLMLSKTVNGQALRIVRESCYHRRQLPRAGCCGGVSLCANVNSTTSFLWKEIVVTISRLL